jgi:hypothetical protein
MHGKVARGAVPETGAEEMNPGHGTRILFMASWLLDLNPVDPVNPVKKT